MRRMALRGLVVALCFVPALMAADAAKKMRPPLPKPKPAQVTTPEASAPNAESSEVIDPETNPFEAQPDQSRSAIVIPREKPAQLREPETTAVESSASEAAAPEATELESRPDQTRSAFVIPREKPARLRKPVPEILPAPAPKPDRNQREGDEKPAPGEDFAICRKELAVLGAKFTVPEMPAAEAKCTVPNPVRIRAIGSPVGEVAFPDGPILNCIFAKQFTTWVSDVAAPAVMSRTGEALAAMTTGPGYECRGRNGDSSAKISEHAFGNAIDIVSFRLASKESIPVSNVTKTGNEEARWLMALRVSACGYFTTVLGPGSNAAHAEHFHLDLGLHGKSANYKICE